MKILRPSLLNKRSPIVRSMSQNIQFSRPNTPTRENLIVRLCGRITESPIQASTNGATLVPMATKSSYDGSLAKHILHVTSMALKNCPIDQFAVDRRIYAIGRIGYNEFTSPSGHHKRTAQIISHTIFPCTELEHPEDINELKLYGHVEHPPRIEDNVTKLVVSTEYFDPKEQSNKKKSHDVVISDENMRREANSVVVGDGIFIHGFLQSNSVQENIENQMMYSIYPTKLFLSQAVPVNFKLHDF